MQAQESLGGTMAKKVIGCEAGLLNRGTIVSAMKQIAFRTGADLNIEEDKRLLDSEYRFTFTGTESQIEQVRIYYRQVRAQLG